MQPLWKREYTELDLVRRHFVQRKKCVKHQRTNKQTNKIGSCTSHNVKFPRFHYVDHRSFLDCGFPSYISWKEKPAAKNVVKEVVTEIIIVELCPNIHL